MAKPTPKQLHCLKVLADREAHSRETAIHRELAWKLMSGDSNRTRGFGPLKYCREEAGWVLDDDRPSGRFLYLSDAGRAVLAQFGGEHIPVNLGNPKQFRNDDEVTLDLHKIEQPIEIDDAEPV